VPDFNTPGLVPWLNPNEANAAYGYDTNVNYPKGVGSDPFRKLHRVNPKRGVRYQHLAGIPPSSAAWNLNRALRDYPAQDNTGVIPTTPCLPRIRFNNGPE